MNYPSIISIELTSRCNKNCWMCGRRKIDKDYPEIVLNYGDMRVILALSLSTHIPNGTLVQFHNNGEPLLYNNLGDVLKSFKGKIRCLNTNAKLLLEKADEIINNLETLTISVIENDPESDEQYEIVKKFLDKKVNQPPFMVYRLLGNVEKADRWYQLPGLVTKRILHSPMGSFNYSKTPVIPEHGICLDLLTHLVIDRNGDVYPCVRFDYNKYNKLGNVKEHTIEELWNSDYRKYLLEEHIKGNRACSKLCEQCEFYGVPRE